MNRDTQLVSAFDILSVKDIHYTTQRHKGRYSKAVFQSHNLEMTLTLAGITCLPDVQPKPPLWTLKPKPKNSSPKGKTSMSYKCQF